VEVKKNEGAVYLRWLKEEGIREYLPEIKTAKPQEARVISRSPADSHSPVMAVTAAGFDSKAWEALRLDALKCVRCAELSGVRKNVVFGAGSVSAPLMFVGEAPGQDEDIQGLPFVGAAGQLLTKIIEAIGLTRDEVYIANVLKCRPPQNRQPKPDEILNCKPYLERQIEMIRPRIICALGAFAAQTLLKTEEPISKLRGQFRDYTGAQSEKTPIKIMSTYHPAYLLRNPAEKRKVWEDMKAIRAELAWEPSAADHGAV
jgi:uracil-DNA glycosylase family 4